MNVALFANLLIGHLLADFPLQLDSWGKNMQDRYLCGYGMWLHGIVVFACEWLALGAISLRWLAFAMALSHILIDYLTVRFLKSGPKALAAKQFLHIVILYVIAKYMSGLINWQQWNIVPKGNELLYPVVFCGYLFCLSPANYAIRAILNYCHVQNGAEDDDDKSNESIRTSGILIGSLERLLILTFILIGSYEAAGWTIAAKSLLRFKDSEGLKTEYVLVGTLLSVSIAVLCAIVVFKFGMQASVLKKP